MRILLITQWFQPEPHFKGLDFAKSLRDKGHEVEVLTGFPNYPGGKIYPGYRVRLFQREIIDGIRVTRGYLYPSHDRSALKRIANYVSFAFSTSLLALFLKKPDVTYVYTPPMTTAMPAVLLKLLRGVPFVPDIQDLWPDTLAATGMVNSPRILSLVGLWTNFVLQQASQIIVLSDGFKKRLEDRGITTPIKVIPNWAPPEITNIADCLPPTSPERSQIFTVLFAGNMGKAQGLETVINAAKILKEREVSVRFDMVGGGVEVDNLKDYASKIAPDMLRFLPSRHPSQMKTVFEQADALLVHLRDDPLFEITIPSKTQAYLAIGKPILLGVRGDAEKIVKKANAGISFAPDCPEALAQAVITLIDMSDLERSKMGKSGKAFYKDKLSFEIGVSNIIECLEDASIQS